MSTDDRLAHIRPAPTHVREIRLSPGDIGPCVRCGARCIRYGPFGNPRCRDCGGPDRDVPDVVLPRRVPPRQRVAAAVEQEAPPGASPVPARPRSLPTLLTAALAYAGRGWPVFLLSPTKTPVANCEPCRDADDDHDREGCTCLTCHGFYAATRDPDRIREMIRRHPTGLLAIRTGAASGLVVVDVDPGNGGMDTLAELHAARLLPPTLTVETGSGGRHFFYAHPGAAIKSGGNLLGPGVDVKADGGYVVAAPSRHPRTGRPYRWAGDGGFDTQPAALHAKVMLRLLKDRVERRPLAAPAWLDRTRSGEAAAGDPAGRLAGLVRTVLEAPPGQRNQTLNWAAYRAAELIRDRHAPEGSIVSALTEAALHAGLTAGETRATIASGLRAGRSA